jgi:predicted secreted protein with PEFG-CTERM motif
MVVDPDIFAIIVQIESPDEGTITLDLPREFIGAEKQDGKDDTFIILIDGIEVPYQESQTSEKSRVITIEFEEGDSDIEIIGTFVIPEFGAIASLVLAISMISLILVSKRNFVKI